MKSLILYASKHGCTKKCAYALAQQINGDVMEISAADGNVFDYDRIIIGSCVYVGMLDKKVKEFCKRYETDLLKKDVRIFLCGIADDATSKELIENLGEEFVRQLKDYQCFGGVLNMKKLSFWERSIIKMVNRKVNLIKDLDRNGSYSFINQEAIKNFVEAMRI